MTGMTVFSFAFQFTFYVAFESGESRARNRSIERDVHECSSVISAYVDVCIGRNTHVRSVRGEVAIQEHICVYLVSEPPAVIGLQ